MDDDFASASSGSSTTFPQQCSALRKNGYVVIKGRPCRITEMSTSKTGKHGHAKVHLVAKDLFTQKKVEDLCPSTHNMDVPHVIRKDYQLTDIEEGYMTLMDDEGNNKEDLKVPEGDIGDEIKTKHKNEENFTVTVMTAMGEEAAVGVKVLT